MSLANERKTLEEDISSKNISIAVIDNDIKHLGEKIDEHIKNLKRLNESWPNYPYLGLPLNEIIIIIDEIDKKITKLLEERNKVKSALDTTRGSIVIMKRKLEDKEEQILKNHKRAPIVLEIEDISSDINIVERGVESNKKYFVICLEELQKNKDNKTRLETNLTKIKTGYELDLLKGKMDKILKEKSKDNPDLVVDEWLSRCTNNRNQIQKTVDEAEKF